LSFLAFAVMTPFSIRKSARSTVEPASEINVAFLSSMNSPSG
jgi:hypothetical protein